MKMKNIDIDISYLQEKCRPVMDQFIKIESKPWDRQTIIIELIGEIGSLAHQLQGYEGFKSKKPSMHCIKDEVSDVLFILLRLARYDNVELDGKMSFTIQETKDSRLSCEIVEICKQLPELIAPSECQGRAEIQSVIICLGKIAQKMEFDIHEAVSFEMDIAQAFFEASGNKWPKPQCITRPLKTASLMKLLLKRWFSK
jgi:hypothetical protein